MRVAPRITVLGWALMVLACSAGGATGGAPRPSSARNRLTAEELANAPDNNAYDAVRRLRPQWLRRRGISSQAPEVFLDNIHAGDLDRLRNIPLTNVEEIRFVSASDATTLWGTGYTAGVIQVIQRH